MDRAHRPSLFRILLCLSVLGFLAACQDPKVPAAADRKPALSAPPTARFVKLEEVTEWTGKAWAAMAEFNLLDATGAIVDRSHWTVSADSSGVSEFPANAIDGDPKSLWHTSWQGAGESPPPPHAFVVSLGASVRISGFRYLPRQDGNANGSIAKYRFYVSDDGLNWGSPVSEGDFSSTGAPTAEKVVVFAEQSANRTPVIAPVSPQTNRMSQAVSLQLAATDADGDAITFAASGLPPGLSISHATGLVTGTPITPGEYTAIISATDGKSTPSTVDLKWTIDPPSIAPSAAPATSGEARFVKLEALSEINGKSWSSIAEIHVVGANGADLPRDGWVVSADSADTSDRPGNAIDGNPSTVWHSQWDGASPPLPHSFIIDLGHVEKLKAVRVLPRQDASTNGVIAKFRIYTSNDGVSWGEAVAEGDFTTMDGIRSPKTVVLR